MVADCMPTTTADLDKCTLEEWEKIPQGVLDSLASVFAEGCQLHRNELCPSACRGHGCPPRLVGGLACCTPSSPPWGALALPLRASQLVPSNPGGCHGKVHYKCFSNFLCFSFHSSALCLLFCVCWVSFFLSTRCVLHGGISCNTLYTHHAQEDWPALEC